MEKFDWARMKTALIVFVFATLVASGIARRHGGHKHHHGPPLPPYLKNVTVDARRDYLRIVFNDTLTIAKQKQAIEKWAKTNKIEEQVKAYNEKRNAQMDEVKKNVTKLIKYLPTALKEFSNIVENENQTPKQIRERRHNLTATHPEAFHVLKFAFEQFMPKHGTHGGRRHGHRGDRRRG
ncbi:hypothetical protein TELCIR_15632, partial [Teladorsagia circumcincta]